MTGAAGVPYDDDPIVVTPDEYRAIVWLAQTELGIKAWQLRQPIEGHRLLGRPIKIINTQETA